MYYMVNAYTAPLDFELPTLHNGKVCSWSRWIDTSLLSPEDIGKLNKVAKLEGFSYPLNAHTVAIFVSEL